MAATTSVATETLNDAGSTGLTPNRAPRSQRVATSPIGTPTITPVTATTTASRNTIRATRHANDGECLIIERHRASDRIAVAKVVLGHRRVDRAGLTNLHVMANEVAPAQHARADGVEVVRSDVVVVDLSFRVGLSEEAFDIDVSRRVTAGKRSSLRIARGVDTRHAAHPVDCLALEREETRAPIVRAAP